MSVWNTIFRNTSETQFFETQLGLKLSDILVNFRTSLAANPCQFQNEPILVNFRTNLAADPCQFHHDVKLKSDGADPCLFPRFRSLSIYKNIRIRIIIVEYKAIQIWTNLKTRSLYISINTFQAIHHNFKLKFKDVQLPVHGKFITLVYL